MTKVESPVTVQDFLALLTIIPRSRVPDVRAAWKKGNVREAVQIAQQFYWENKQ
jgi:hypothetical protein